MINPEIHREEELAIDTSWFKDAACADQATNLFFEGPVHLAQRICMTQCVVREECYKYAVHNNEQFGVWGGVIFTQRRKK